MKRSGNPIIPVGSTDLHLAAHLFHPPRLRLVRELRGLTKSELAERVGKSPAAIGQFEGGGRAACRPDPQTLAALALTLGVPVGFFTRQSPARSLAVDSCHFRSLRSASQRERRKLLARASLLCDLVSLLEQHVELPAEHVSMLAAEVQGQGDIERLAGVVRKAWGLGLGPIGNLVNLLEREGVVVSHIPGECEEVDAFSTSHEGRPLVFLVIAKRSTSRTRFDAAHELGHLVMHADVEPGSPTAEREANQFASAFLLPAESFAVECPRRLDWDHLYELKRRWKVSVSALVKRAFDLRCLSQASYRRAFVRLNRTGERFAERDEPPPEAPTLIAQSLAAIEQVLSRDAIAHELGLGVRDLEQLVK